MVPLIRYALRVVSIMSASVLVASCSDDVGAQQQPAHRTKPVVGAQVLHSQQVTLSTELPGRTTAHLVAEVRPRVSGIIRRRAFVEGGSVRAGDVLYELDSTSFEAAVRNGEAVLRRAESAIPSARARFERYRHLNASNVISRQDLDDARTQLLQAEADVSSAIAAVESARINLGYTRVRAPIGGRIDASNVTEGALVTEHQETALTTIRQQDVINVDLVRSSASLLALNKAVASQKVKTKGGLVAVGLLLEDGSRYPHPGKLEFHSSAVSSSTGMVSFRATFPNPEGLLMPGMYVRALVEEGYIENSFLLPQRAVSRNPRGQAIAKFVNPAMKIEERILSVVRGVGNSWLVDGGVNEGDRVVVEGLQRVELGQEVDVNAVRVDDTTGEVHLVAAEKSAVPDPENDRQASIRVLGVTAQ